ncbi:MAG: YiiX/YebB-like N1pC/P60 family cysteine hydrolase [Flavobacteriaceae bacterium]
MFRKVYFALFFLLVGCSASEILTENDLKNGDFIFVEAREENLSGAINRVTQKSEIANFDHLGVIEISNEGIFVLHASPKLGSAKEPLKDFYEKNTETQQEMVIYRLKDDYQPAIPKAIEKAEQMLGKPYNFTYILDDQSYYCSDFVERAFRESAVFEHIPMNFKNKEGEIDSFWISFYEKLQLEVPQDEPGTNPNQLAGSDKLIRKGKFSRN